MFGYCPNSFSISGPKCDYSSNCLYSRKWIIWISLQLAVVSGYLSHLKISSSKDLILTRPDCTALLEDIGTPPFSRLYFLIRVNLRCYRSYQLLRCCIYWPNEETYTSATSFRSSFFKFGDLRKVGSLLLFKFEAF